jgi:ankyrin repeat protein
MLVNCTDDNCTKDEWTHKRPLTIAVANRHVEVVRVLLENGADVERTENFQQTALHFAASEGEIDICRLLLDFGAKVDSLNSWNASPLHEAALLGHLSVVKLLVERGADVSRKNVHGETPSDRARSFRYNVVADWLDSVSHVKETLMFVAQW